MIVVDASVAAKWLLPEAGAAEALALLASAERLFAPALIRIEVGGAILRRYRAGTFPEDQIRLLLNAWNDLLGDGSLGLIPNDELIDAAHDLAIQARHDLADCLYLAAGRQLAAEVVTADRKLFERGTAVHERMTLLEGIGGH